MLVFALVSLLGCGTATETASEAPSALPSELLAKSWEVQFAGDREQEALLAKSAGWKSLVLDRDYRAATIEFKAVGGLTAARGHAEAAALYRQAALLMGNAFLQTYGTETVNETTQRGDASDPASVAHLLAIGQALNGHLDKAAAEAAKLPADDPTAAYHAPWKAWFASGAPPVWPPDFAGLPQSLPAVAVGEWPEVAGLPHFTMVERSETKSTVPMGDPGELVALAMWHEEAARLAAGADAKAVVTYGARYRFASEPPVADTANLPVELLFGSDYLVAEDGPFMAEVTAKGASAVDAWKDRSAIAALAVAARGADGGVDAEKAVDLAAEVRKEVLRLSREATKAEENTSSQRMFSDMAEVGVLRNLALVAEIEGHHDTSGRLRINARDKTDNHTGCPVALLSLGAWDAGNQYPQRAADFVHDFSRRYPSLETAQYGIDVLSVRMSRQK
jgi:hypothetical protein